MADGRRPFVAGSGPGRRAEREAHRPSCCCRGRLAAAGCSDDDEGRLRAWPYGHHSNTFSAACDLCLGRLLIGMPIAYQPLLNSADVCGASTSCCTSAFDLPTALDHVAPTHRRRIHSGTGCYVINGRERLGSECGCDGWSSGRLSSWQRSAFQRCFLFLANRRSECSIWCYLGPALVVTDLRRAAIWGLVAGFFVKVVLYSLYYHYEWFPFRSRHLGPLNRSRSRLWGSRLGCCCSEFMWSRLFRWSRARCSCVEVDPPADAVSRGRFDRRKRGQARVRRALAHRRGVRL